MTTVQLVLVIGVVIGALLTIAAKLRPRPSAPGTRLSAEWQEYIFKPLTTALIIGIALADDDPISTEYRVLILLGLIASLAGDVFLMLPGDRFVPGLISFLVAQVLYIAAFTYEGNGHAPAYFAIPFLLYGLGMLAFLWKHLGDLRGPVMVYMTVILLMGLQAANRHFETDQEGTLLALIGAYFFIASDSALALERFRGSWRSAPVWVLGLYYAAQTLIALSI